MRPESLISDNRYMSEHFNRDEYPEMIDRIESQLEKYFGELSSEQDMSTSIAADISSILNEVEDNMNRCRFNFRRKSVFADDHIVLSLFIAPAAAKIGTPPAKEFAETLASMFTERFPGTTFKVGDYDEIMEGFKWKLTLISK